MSWATRLLPLLILGCASVLFAAPPSDYVVQTQVTVQQAPPQVKLAWTNVAGGSGYSVNRREWNSKEGFAGVASDLPGTAKGWTDNDVKAGTKYEYQIIREGKPKSHGYVSAGIGILLVDDRGTVVLLVDQTQVAPLSVELARLQADLAGDGWKVIRHDVVRSTAEFGDKTPWAGYNTDKDGAVIQEIKGQIKADAAADNAVSHVLILGHAPVPYSGALAPDGHFQHAGAQPADVYYGDLDGVWTDTSVNKPYLNQVGGANNANLPGDGRFDQNAVPGSGRQLAVGRVDLSNLRSFAPLTETDLLRRYLDKNHAWRTGQWPVQSKCVVGGVIEDLGGNWGAPAQSGWRTASVVGLGNVVTANWFTSPMTQSFLFADACGWGSPTTCAGVGKTADFATLKYQAVFNMLFGSYFCDWNLGDNFMRAVLANDGYGLTCLWAGRPHAVIHRAALGATIGDNWRLTQEATFARYPDVGGEPRGVHISLMGDPTLRVHPIVPPGAPAVVAGKNVVLNWTASPTPGVIGYHIYRAATPTGPFVRRTGVPASIDNPSGAPITETTWTDTDVPPGTCTYLIKAVKLETTPGGTYYNTSLGAAVTRELK